MPSFSDLPGVKVFCFVASAPALVSQSQTRSAKFFPRNKMKDQRMKKLRSLAPAIAGLLVAFNSFGQFADSVVSYTQGAGVPSGYNDPTHALGAPTTFIGYQ